MTSYRPEAALARLLRAPGWTPCPGVRPTWWAALACLDW